ncbi:MAG: hypothetical protein SWX82_27525 [Cyanobacteriota bacterium]|nr:hypothetical protein [Cyanobacteriota bacterium]
MLHESCVLNIHSAVISPSFAIIIIYWTIVIAVLMSAIRSKCGSYIAFFGNDYYLSIGQ